MSKFIEVKTKEDCPEDGVPPSCHHPDGPDFCAGPDSKGCPLKDDSEKDELIARLKDMLIVERSRFLMWVPGSGAEERAKEQIEKELKEKD